MTDVLDLDVIKAFESMLRLGLPGYALALQTHSSISDDWIHVYTTGYANWVTCCGIDMMTDSRAQWHTGGDFLNKGRWCPVCVLEACRQRRAHE